MLNKLFKIISLIIISLILSFLTYKLCYFIAEKYFFDKFFYQKNIEYGYWIPDKQLSLQNFGDRAKDLVSLVESKDTNILGISDNKNFKIAIIGDSYVWGQGLKNNERFSTILEKKLNRIRPTKVFSLGNCGDNLFDNYIKYKQSINVFGEMNLYIFGLVDNDLFYNTFNRYDTKTIIIDKLKTNCPSIAIYTPENSNMNEIEKMKTLDKKFQNYCVFKQIIPYFPREKTIYFITEDYDDYSPFFKEFRKYFNNKYVISAKSGKDIPKYNKYFNDPYKYFTVSPKESHPNALANQMYADILYNEITTNPRWGF